LASFGWTSQRAEALASMAVAVQHFHATLLQGSAAGGDVVDLEAEVIKPLADGGQAARS
jgi:hypothetical protein